MNGGALTYAPKSVYEILALIGPAGWQRHRDEVGRVHGLENATVDWDRAETRLTRAMTYQGGQVIDLDSYNVVTFSDQFPNGYATVQSPAPIVELFPDSDTLLGQIADQAALKLQHDMDWRDPDVFYAVRAEIRTAIGAATDAVLASCSVCGDKPT